MVAADIADLMKVPWAKCLLGGADCSATKMASNGALCDELALQVSTRHAKNHAELGMLRS